MTREELEAELTAFVDGELEPARAAEVSAALAQHEDLRALEVRLRAQKTLLAGLGAPEASAALRAAVLAAVERPTWRERVGAWLTPPRLGLAVAAGVAVGTVAWWVQPAASSFGGDEEKLLVAQNLELLEDYEMLEVRDAQDLEVIAALNELEAQP